MTQTAPRAARNPFCKWRRPAKAWAEFQQWWAEEHPGSPLPSNVPSLHELTGISERTLERLLSAQKETPPNGAVFE